jgi:hypothetical protein
VSVYINQLFRRRSLCSPAKLDYKRRKRISPFSSPSVSSTAPMTATVTERQSTVTEPRLHACGSELLSPPHARIYRRLHPKPLELLDPPLEGRTTVGARAATRGHATTGGLSPLEHLLPPGRECLSSPPRRERPVPCA